MRFSSKSVENIGIHMISGVLFEKPVFHFKPSEASFFLGDVSCLMAVGKSKMVVGKFQLLENPKWLLENPKKGGDDGDGDGDA